MLSDGTLRGLKPEATAYKVADRDGMYVTVSPKGTITFRLDYRLNGRRETLTVGRIEDFSNRLRLMLFRQSVRTKDDGKHRSADPEVPVQVDHAASPSSFLARGNTVMAPTS